MSNLRFDFLSPVGRLVQGSLFEPQTTDADGNALIIKNGPNAGKAGVKYFFGVAFPKTAPELQTIFAKMREVAAAGFPGGQSNAPSFAWKFIDGDTIDSKGKPYADREGFKGCYVFRYSGSYAPEVWTTGGAQLITDPNAVKRGYFVRVWGSISPNNSQQRPGLYFNHDKVEFVAYGDEIRTGPDGAAIFGAAPVATLPPGATATPPAPMPSAAFPGAPGAASAPPAFPAAPVPPQAPPAFLAPPAAPAAPVSVPPAVLTHPQNPAFVSYDNGATWVQR